MGQRGAGGMYIREIARTLYRLKRELEQLEQAYESQPLGEQRDFLERDLFKTRAEYLRVKKILDGAKGTP